MDSMLSKALREFITGPLKQLIVNMGGEDGAIVEEELNKFNRREPCWVTTTVAQWTKPKPAPSILSPISGAIDLELNPTDGTETLANASDVFTSGIDGDFQRWGTNVPGKPTLKTKAQVFEIVQDGDYKTIFKIPGRSLDSLCWEQSQIKAFVKKHKKWLRTEGYATLFLFKVGEGDKKQYFVAFAYLYSGGPHVCVFRFSDTSVWYAKYRSRVVLPQQTLES